MTGGSIFVGGEIESLGINTTLEDPTPDELQMIKEFAQMEEIEFEPMNFKKIVPGDIRSFDDLPIHLKDLINPTPDSGGFSTA